MAWYEGWKVEPLLDEEIKRSLMVKTSVVYVFHILQDILKTLRRLKLIDEKYKKLEQILGILIILAFLNGALYVRKGYTEHEQLQLERPYVFYLAIAVILLWIYWTFKTTRAKKK